MVDDGRSSCFLTGTVAHEFGHAVGIPRDKFGRHSRNRSDRVYQFGEYAAELCKAKQDDYPLPEQRIGEPPVVEIIAPAEGADLVYSGFDDMLGMWFADVQLVGEAVDAEDGALDGAALEWSTDRADLQSNVHSLGTGTSLTVRLYSDTCFGTDHRLTLTAIDSDGNRVEVSRLARIYTLC